jgi:hypothetical protein
MLRKAVSVVPPQIRFAVADATASSRKPMFSDDPARESPEVQSAATRVALSRRTRMLAAQAVSGAVAPKTNDAAISRRT